MCCPPYELQTLSEQDITGHLYNRAWVDRNLAQTHLDFPFLHLEWWHAHVLLLHCTEYKHAVSRLCDSEPTQQACHACCLQHSGNNHKKKNHNEIKMRILLARVSSRVASGVFSNKGGRLLNSVSITYKMENEMIPGISFYISNIRTLWNFQVPGERKTKNPRHQHLEDSLFCFLLLNQLGKWYASRKCSSMI